MKRRNRPIHRKGSPSQVHSWSAALLALAPLSALLWAVQVTGVGIA